MNYDLKIRQSYHGNGVKEGYKYKIYDSKGKKLGELKNVPVKCLTENTVSINGVIYIISNYYSSPNPREKRSEVEYYELSKYEYKPDFDLGNIIKVGTGAD